MTDDTSNRKSCELCSSTTDDNMRLCATCYEMIQRLSWISTGPQPSSQNAAAGAAHGSPAEPPRHKRALNINIFNASEYANE